MPVTVGVNGMSVVHAQSGGVSIAAPDSCFLSTPNGPIVLPLPNVAESKDLQKGTKKVKCDGQPVGIDGSAFGVSTGDEAGKDGGVASGKTKGKAEFVLFSFDVKFEGKGVARAMDLMTHNDKNTPPSPLIQGPVLVIAPPKDAKKICLICGEEFA